MAAGSIEALRGGLSGTGGQPWATARARVMVGPGPGATGGAADGFGGRDCDGTAPPAGPQRAGRRPAAATFPGDGWIATWRGLELGPPGPAIRRAAAARTAFPACWPFRAGRGLGPRRASGGAARSGPPRARAAPCLPAAPRPRSSAAAPKSESTRPESGGGRRDGRGLPVRVGRHQRWLDAINPACFGDRRRRRWRRDPARGAGGWRSGRRCPRRRHLGWRRRSGRRLARQGHGRNDRRCSLARRRAPRRSRCRWLNPAAAPSRSFRCGGRRARAGPEDPVGDSVGTRVRPASRRRRRPQRRGPAGPRRAPRRAPPVDGGACGLAAASEVGPLTGASGAATGEAGREAGGGEVVRVAPESMVRTSRETDGARGAE